MSNQGLIYVVSAPSGTGKTTLLKRVMGYFPEIRFSISYTTRPPRPGERDGKDYHFISPQRFQQMVEKGAFTEWAEVLGNRYGTSMDSIRESRSQGVDMILDIDSQGAIQIKGQFKAGIFIFIMPPSLEALKQRLKARGVDGQKVIQFRVAHARDEMKQAKWYDYIIVNERVEEAAEQLKSIIIAERCRRSRVLKGIGLRKL
ncbi:MAG: guanylate kinase [Syntrophobacterales bacterium]|nr:MAG: guanylate kinase [Syntrophobacterales bacterium]